MSKPERANHMHQLLRVLRPQQAAMVRLLRRLVETESPSYEKAAVDRVGRIIAAEWRKRGARVTLLRRRQRGDHVRAEIPATRGAAGGQILILGHLDTVYPIGTLEKMPFRVAKGYAWGPGAFDMKGGLVLALFAVDALRLTGADTHKRLVFLWTTDEEIGSETSRAAIEREARRSDAVLVLEPSFGPEGRLKTQRKGVGEAEIRVTGRAAHAGINPQDGVNAVHELALQIARLIKMNDRSRGITVQAGVIRGGTFTNVIPAEASARIDLRVARAADVERLNRRLRALRPILKGAQVQITGGVNRPPLERAAAVRALFHRARGLAAQIGIRLGEAATGGGSDGNFTAALGIPTLDGLGVIGEGAHTPSERVLLRALPGRAALIAGLLGSFELTRDRQVPPRGQTGSAAGPADRRRARPSSHLARTAQ